MLFHFGDFRCLSQGRNGNIQTHGLIVTTYEHKSTLDLIPETSKGAAGNCCIEIPYGAMDQLCEWWLKERGKL